MKNKRILILYASIGSGHKIAGQAINEAFTSMGYDTKIEDILNYSEIAINPLTKNIYIRNKALGDIYNFIWKQDFTKEITQRSASILKENFRPLNELILHYKPDAIICTHSLAGVLGKIFAFQVPVYAVITDYKPTPVWLAPPLIHYFIPNLYSKLYLLREGINIENITITGIPVREGFRNVSNSRIINPDTSLNIFFLAGGLNPINYFKLTNKLIPILQEISKTNKLVVVCGSNLTLKNKLGILKSDNVQIYGEVVNPASLINEADLVLTKPGGLICAESLAIGKPLVLIGKGYGQERANVEYITINGAGVSVEQMSKIPEMIKLIQNNSVFSSMQQNAVKLGNPNATVLIVRKIIKDLKLT